MVLIYLSFANHNKPKERSAEATCWVSSDNRSVISFAPSMASRIESIAFKFLALQLAQRSIGALLLVVYTQKLTIISTSNITIRISSKLFKSMTLSQIIKSRLTEANTLRDLSKDRLEYVI